MEDTKSDISDADSVGSWTFLENAHTEKAECSSDCSSGQDDVGKYDLAKTKTEKGEDSDSISIISETETESISKQNLSESGNVSPLVDEELQNLCRADSVADYDTYCPINESYDKLLFRNDDSNDKVKIYVHKRNNRISTMLNVILLGSVISAAGIALGHMWGLREDCSEKGVPSVNKVLSALYKLQEENAYLRSKLEEVSGKGYANNCPSDKHPRKRVFEEPLLTSNSKLDASKANIDLKPELIELENIYKENQKFIDRVVENKFKQFSDDKLSRMTKVTQDDLLELNLLDGEFDGDTVVPLSKGKYKKGKREIKKSKKSDKKKAAKVHGDIEKIERKSYADSLKSISDAKKPPSKKSNEIPPKYEKKIKENRHKLNEKKSTQIFDAYSDDNIIMKDNRFKHPKQQLYRDKHDRQKSFKKQKRENKYEQWEMKNVHPKDIDSFEESSHRFEDDKNYKTKGFPQKEGKTKDDMEFSTSDETVVQDSDQKILIDELKSARQEAPEKGAYGKKDKSENTEFEELGWYDKMIASRSEARNKRNRNRAHWYFTRMQSREQCRSKNDTVYQKLSKRDNNFKTKR